MNTENILAQFKLVETSVNRARLPFQIDLTQQQNLIVSMYELQRAETQIKTIFSEIQKFTTLPTGGDTITAISTGAQPEPYTEDQVKKAKELKQQFGGNAKYVCLEMIEQLKAIETHALSFTVKFWRGVKDLCEPAPIDKYLCSVCHNNPVDAENGIDTCDTCLNKI